MKTDRGKAVRGKGGRLQNARLVSRITAMLQHQNDLAAKPATDKQLARIWSPWNALPADMLPEEKCWILTFDENGKHGRNPTRLDHFRKLRRRFPFLPLCPHEYNQSLEQAVQWSKLIGYIQTTFQGHKSLVETRLSYQGYDADPSGRVAIYRAANELRLLRSGFLEIPAPNLADIAHLENRYAAYKHAREQALAALSDLVFKVPGMRTGKELPLDEQALGVPNPPTGVPRHLFLARLDALGICNQERLNEFLCKELPKLKRSKRMQFERMRRKPKYGKNPYAGFRVWVLENRPIFENDAFGWQWKDILKAAVGKCIDCPQTCLKQWAYRSNVHLKVKLGQPSIDAKGIKRSSQLLSPAPVFGEALKEAPV
jgi:hypothetical protein